LARAVFLVCLFLFWLLFSPVLLRKHDYYYYEKPV
jgi:hypothetical protein